MKAAEFVERAVAEIRAQAGGEKVVMALSGAWTAPSAPPREPGHRDPARPIYVDTGLMRKGETERITGLFGDLPLHVVRAEDRFFGALKGSRTRGEAETDREQFIRVFEQEARAVNAKHLLQGTIYPTVSRARAG